MKVFYSGLQEDPYHKESVPLLIFNLAYLEGGFIFFRVLRILWRGSGSTDIDGSGLYFLL